MKKLSANLPFPGFYESILSSGMDYTLEREIEWKVEEERNQPKEIRLDENDLFSIYDRNLDYSVWREYLAKEWCEAFQNYFSEIVEEQIKFDFEEITSPKWYNFETDRVFASISLKDTAKLYAKAKSNQFTDLAECISERFTRRDGFIPHYSNNIEVWLAKPLSQWDHNEVGTLILSFLKGEHDFDFGIYESLSENGDFDDGMWAAFNNESFEKDLEEIRQEKLEAVLEEDPDFILPPPRCPLTIDMCF